MKPAHSAWTITKLNIATYNTMLQVNSRDNTNVEPSFILWCVWCTSYVNAIILVKFVQLIPNVRWNLISTQGWGQIRICICKYKYKYKYGVFVFVFVFAQKKLSVFVFVFVFDARIWCIWQIQYQIHFF